jgi:hypothetical protein
MTSGRPPFTRPSPPVDPRLDAARGSLRDTIGALQNLEQLLKSLRVGPRALGGVIPDVRASLDSLSNAQRDLIGALGPQISGDPALDAIEHFMSPRVESLERALRAAERGPLNAKSRLTLERVVSASASELDVARALVELLEEAVHGPTTRVDLLELVRGAADEAAGDKIVATLSAPDKAVELVVNPRVASPLVAIGVRLVDAHGRHGAPHVAVSRTSPSECSVTIDTGRVTGERLIVVKRPIIAPTVPCAEAAARLAGARLEWSPDGAQFALYWPTALGP